MKRIENKSSNIILNESNSDKEYNINSKSSSEKDDTVAEDRNDTHITTSKEPITSNVDNKATFRQTETSNLINDNRGVPVLYYHSVRESADNEVTIKPEILREHLKYINEQGYTTLTMKQLEDYILNNSPIPEKSILITFDDGYMDNYYNAFPILKEFNMTATIFCITSELDGSYYLSKEAIKEISDYGIDIESHTVTHPHLNKLKYDKQLEELLESKKTLEGITGKEITSIAYPFGDFDDNSVKAAKEAGYTLGFTTKLGLSDRNDNPLVLDRIYISSEYNMNTFKELLNKTKK
ncbi:polysaccharide deacetylase family protein [Clostridium sp. C2-6-12]|uniref:polysaccharide deacetylase family protein n=1 Tax=Clostridium sp. C2-6-12 TaxID=2698832 RepID=UPI00136B5BF0|nr:polysaccharide deacetylase family protein [Clostridium sp. C2-6-12]